MAGGITYDGVKTEDGGNIFEGTSFWVAQRVPMRNSIVETIKDNGGTIVPLENKADMLIADHALKKVAPLASYSWQYITDSVKNGISQVPDKYRIHPDPEDARPINGPGPRKGGRTPYTKTDDAQLAAWVLNHTGGREGNEIYKELERIDPRHPWQSWRDRWVKQLRPLPMHQLEHLAECWYSLGITRPGMEKPESKPGQEAQGGSRGERMGEGRQAPAVPPRPVTMGMNNPPLDPEARARLAAQARAASATAKKTQEQIREDSAKQRQQQEQQHAALMAQRKLQLQQQQAAAATQSNMQKQKAAAAVKYLASRNNAQDDEDSDSEEDDFEQAAPPRHLRSTPPRPTDGENSKGKAIATQVPLSFEDEEDEDSESEQIRQQALLSKVNKTLSRSLAGPTATALSQSTAHRRLSASQVPGATAPADEEASEDDAEDSAASESVNDESEDEEPRTREKAARFYKDLLAFDGVKPENFQEGLLEGPDGVVYEISLYYLCEAVILFNDPAAGIDWQQVAERLELDEHDWVSAALEVCYYERLRDFYEEVINSESQAVNDDGIEAQIRQQLESEAELPSMSNQLPERLEASGEDDEREEETRDENRAESEAEEGLAWPATQDLTPRPQKRKIERVESTASVRKRRRESEGAEIQSTPDTAVKRAEQQRQQQLYDFDDIEESQEPRQRPVKRRVRNQIEYGVPEPRRSTRATRSRTYESIEPEPQPTAKQGSSAAGRKDKGKGKDEVIEIPDTYEEDEDLGTEPVTQLATQTFTDVMGDVHESDDVFMDMDGEPVQGTDDDEEEIPTPRPRKATKRSKLPFGQSSGNEQPHNTMVPQPNMRPSASPSEFWTPSPQNATRDPVKEGKRSSLELLKERVERGITDVMELKEYLVDTLGYEPLAAEEAIHRVSTIPGEALIECVHALHQGEPFQPSYEGIWTDEDDKWLSQTMDYDWKSVPESQGEVKLREYRKKQRDRLRKKHLVQGMNERLRYLGSNTYSAYKERKRLREEEEMRRMGAREGTVSTARWAAFQAQ